MWIHLRGEDLGHSDYKFSNSQRVHFIAEVGEGVGEVVGEGEGLMWDILEWFVFVQNHEDIQTIENY